MGYGMIERDHPHPSYNFFNYVAKNIKNEQR